jgi:hypothetical protein
VENDVFGIETEARSVVEAIGINCINIFLKKIVELESLVRTYPR